VIRVPECEVARVEPAAGRQELAVPQELHFSAGRLAVIAEFTRDPPALFAAASTTNRPGAPSVTRAVAGRVPPIGHALTMPPGVTAQVSGAGRTPSECESADLPLFDRLKFVDGG
jgi:hypothetical protein